ncbi:unnamed protein product [Orchesella dallaii]|uniref:Uncharacterized protein n=1 Tax=Orchesella dallaii TaxID=48710 RepID=A0ABP1Q7W3_9HEXA
MNYTSCSESTTLRDNSTSFQSADGRRIQSYLKLRHRGNHLLIAKALKLSNGEGNTSPQQNVFSEVKTEFRYLTEYINNNIPKFLNDAASVAKLQLKDILTSMRGKLVMLFNAVEVQQTHDMSLPSDSDHREDVLDFSKEGEKFLEDVFDWMGNEIMRTISIKTEEAEVTKSKVCKIIYAITDMLYYGLELLSCIFS